MSHSAESGRNIDTPAWLSSLAGAARGMPVPDVLRPPERGGRRSAILILFGEGDHGPDLLLIQRSDGLRRHSGQPAFPGGRMEESDTSPEDTALREAEEETALDPSGIELIGRLPELYIQRSGFRVAPVLAWWRTPSTVRPADLAEVARVVRVPVADLVDPANRVRTRGSDGDSRPAYRVQGMLVWGFTAAIVHQMLVLGGWESADTDNGTGETIEVLPPGPPDGGVT